MKRELGKTRVPVITHDDYCSSGDFLAHQTSFGTTERILVLTLTPRTKTEVPGKFLTIAFILSITPSPSYIDPSQRGMIVGLIALVGYLRLASPHLTSSHPVLSPPPPLPFKSQMPYLSPRSPTSGRFGVKLRTPRGLPPR